MRGLTTPGGAGELGEPAPERTMNIGIEVRARRTAVDMSIAELGRRAGVSAAFISQVEAGRSSMSIPTLYRVASALGCSANALLGASESRPHVTRAGSGMTLPASSGRRTQLTRLLSRTGDDARLESFHYLIAPGDDELEWFCHGGEDFVYVIAGSIAIEFDDGAIVELGSGDSLHHAGAVGHRWVLRGEMTAEVLCVVAPDG